MQKRKYSDVAKEVRSVLLTYPHSVSLEEFLKSYKSLLGEWLPSRALGYESDVLFLQSMPNVVNVHTDSSGKVLLSGIADEASEHIQNLVRKQKKPPAKKSNKGFLKPRYPTPARFPTAPFIFREQPFLSGPLRAEILNLMGFYNNGITFSAFVIAYRKKYNRCLPLVQGLESLEAMINLIPELEVRVVSNEKTIFFTNSKSFINSNRQEISAIGNNRFQPQHSNGMNNNIQHPTINNIHRSGIPKDVLQNFQQLLQKYPKGIIDVNFPRLYEDVTKKPIELFELGYKSLIDLVDSLPDMFKRVKDPNGGKNWIIFPAGANVADSLKAGNLTSPSSQMQTSLQKIQEGVPADVASPSLQFTQPKLLENFNFKDYIPVYVSSIIHPCLFWFQLQTDDAVEEFEKFEKDMGAFYDDYAIKYTMKECDISIDATCVVCNPSDGLWYRGVIKSIPCSKLVNVSYVDYGSRENVPRANIYYVRNKFHEYPAYAFKAQLSGVKPPNNESTWSTKAINRFIDLCKCLPLMARLKPVDEDTFSTYMCDTSGELDVYLNDTLINEGLAELSFENLTDVVDDCSLPSDCKEPIFNGITNESECLPESPKHKYCTTESNETTSLSESDVERKLVFSPKQQVNEGAKLNISQDLERQVTKRYVKQVQLCEEYKAHIINLENKLFMTSGELTRLIWSEKDSSDLIDRLGFKEVDVPFVEVSKENYTSLFEQCIWYKIPEYEKLESEDSSMILYSLDSAFHILNVFGHPSVCLRVAIQKEIKSFDPFDPIWKEFTYDGLDELSDDEKEIEKELSKLCVYDLKTKNEAFKIRRILLERVNNASVTQEIKRLDSVLHVIDRRIKQIETICSQYSSCN